MQLLDYLEQQHYETITFETIASDRGLLKAPTKKIIISFDDCPKHLFDFAIPELVKRKMKAVFYMPTAHINGYNSWDVQEGKARVELMTEQDLLVLSELGMEVGGHSHHHVKLNGSMNPGAIQYEISHCKKILESIVGKPLISFAFPFAVIPVGYKNYLLNAGYLFGCSIYQPFENRFALRRFIYHDGDTVKSLQQKLSWQYRIYRKLTDQLKKNK